MSSAALLAALLFTSLSALVGCPDRTPDRPADCAVEECDYSWGLIGVRIWDCGEGNEDEILIESDYLTEGPFPTRSPLGRYPCGTDVSEELGFPADSAHADSPACAALGIPVDRIGEWDSVCEDGGGDDDDSAR